MELYVTRNYYTIYSFKSKLQSRFIQFNRKNKDSLSFPLFAPLFKTLDLSLVEGCHTSRFCPVNRALSYSRANQDGVLGIPSHPPRCTFFLLLFLFVFFLFIPLSLFQQANPVRLTRWNFSTLFSRPCARYQIPSFPPSSPRASALYFMCTLVPSSSSRLSVKPNLHGLLSTIIPDETSKTKEKYFHKNNHSRRGQWRSCFLLLQNSCRMGDSRRTALREIARINVTEN